MNEIPTTEITMVAYYDPPRFYGAAKPVSLPNAVVLVHTETGLTAKCGKERSMHLNKKQALDELNKKWRRLRDEHFLA
jgi:hypothetical protein